MWETGQRKPSGELMFAAARLFDCTVDELWAECFSSDSEDHTMSEMYG
jgi:DNA-binding XRE family transcriptional regulator